MHLHGPCSNCPGGKCWPLVQMEPAPRFGGHCQHSRNLSPMARGRLSCVDAPGCFVQLPFSNSSGRMKGFNDGLKRRLRILGGNVVMSLCPHRISPHWLSVGTLGFRERRRR